MPRIPRAEVSLETRIADQPFSTGDGYSAPGRAMQQLGQGLSALGSGLDAWAAQDDRENQALDQLDLYNRKMRSDENHQDFAQKYWADPNNDGSDFAELARQNAAAHYSDFSARSRAYQGAKGQLALARLQDTPRFYTEQRAGRERVLVDRATDGLTGHFSTLPKDGDGVDDQKFVELLRERVAGARMLIDAIPVGPQRKALAEHAADLAFRALAARGRKELTIADELTKLLQSSAGASGQGAAGETGGSFGDLTSGKAGRARSDGAGIRGWVTRDAQWKGLNQFEKAAAMALMEADGMRSDDAKNALGAMINRAAKNGEDLGLHVSRAIYQPTFEPAQQARLGSILNSPAFRQLTAWAEKRASGQEPDPVNGATHFLAHEKTMLALEAREPGKYRSWRGWSGFDAKTGQYSGVRARDGSHAFVAPGGAFSYAGDTQGTQTTARRSGGILTSLEDVPSADDGRSVNGAQVFRADDASAAPKNVVTAQGGPVATDAGGVHQRTYSDIDRALLDRLLRERPAMEARHQKAIEDAVKAAEEMVPKGVLLPQEQMASLGALLDKTNRKDLQARFFAAIVGAQATAQYQKATPFEIEAETNRLRQQILGGKATPQASSVMVKHIEALEKLQERISADLKKDPLSLAVQTGQMPNYREITKDGFSIDALNNRITEARAVSQRYGIDLHAFTPGEVTWMTDVMKAGGKPMETMLGTIAASFGPDTPAAMKQFAKHAPVAAQVGWLVSRQGNPETIRDLARGVAMQQDEKHKSIAPTPGQAWMQATKVMGASLAQLAGPNGDGQQAVVDAANILYDVRARAKGVSKQGGSDFDSALWDKGFREVLGENTVGDKTYGGVSTAGGWFGGLHYIVPPNIANDAVPKLLQNLKPTDIYGGGLPVEKGAADIKPRAPGPGAVQEVTPPGSLLQTRKREPAPEGPIDKFEAEGISQTAAAMRMTGTAPAPDQPVGSRGEPVSMATIRQGKLVTVGDGRYWIATGDLDDPKYIKALDGRNWVLDLHQYEPVLRRRVPDAYRPN